MNAFVQRLVYGCGARNVVDYSQGADARTKQDPGLTGNGWCFGMSVQWCIAMAEGTDFWAWLNTLEAVSKFRFIMARQAIGGKLGNAWEDASQAANQYLKSHNLTRLAPPASMDVRLAHNGSSTTIRDKLTQVVGSFSLIKLSGSAPHAMAAWARPDAAMVFMDPNAGQFEFDSPENFRNFFRYFMADWKLFRGQSYMEADTTFRVDKYAVKTRPRSTYSANPTPFARPRQAPSARGIVIGARRS